MKRVQWLSRSLGPWPGHRPSWRRATGTVEARVVGQRQYEFLPKIKLKSLILAQIERWRHALHMQVERQRGGNPGGERRTGEESIGTYPEVGDNAAKAALIPHILYAGKKGTW